MQAIRTVKLNPTDRSGARVKATAAAGSVTLPWDHSLRHDLEANHRLAAEALVAKFNWDADGYGSLASGSPASTVSVIRPRVSVSSCAS